MTNLQMQNLAHVATAACWLAVLGLWVLGAAWGVWRGPQTREHAPIQGGIAGGVIVTWLLVELLVPRASWNTVSIHEHAVRLVGLGLLVASTLLTMWARLVLGTMWSGDPTVKEGHQLRTTGPYGLTRHPIYTGLLGMLAGTTLLLGAGVWIALIPAALAVILIKVHVEERLMRETFPDTYGEYCHRVPRLLPICRGWRRIASRTPRRSAIGSNS